MGGVHTLSGSALRVLWLHTCAPCYIFTHPSLVSSGPAGATQVRTGGHRSGRLVGELGILLRHTSSFQTSYKNVQTYGKAKIVTNESKMIKIDIVASSVPLFPC